MRTMVMCVAVVILLCSGVAAFDLPERIATLHCNPADHDAVDKPPYHRYVCSTHGVRAVVSFHESEDMTQAFDSLVNEVARRPRATQIRQSTRTIIRSFPWMTSTWTYEEIPYEGKLRDEMHAILYLGSCRNAIVKVRVTFKSFALPGYDRIHKRFMEELSSVLQPVQR